MKVLFGALIGAYADAWRFARALPWLIGAMITAEIIQHAIEAHLGMFASPASRAAALIDPLRMGFGWIKMLVFYAVGFFALRYFAFGDVSTTLRPNVRSVRRYLWVALFQTVIAVGVIYAKPLLALLGVAAAGVTPLRLALSLLQQLTEPALLLWYVNAAAGTSGYRPAASVRTTGLFYFWALALMFLTRLPLNGLHQLLNLSPTQKLPALMWLALVADAFVVGFMVAAIAAVEVRIARHLADRRGRNLLSETVQDEVRRAVAA